VEQRRQGAIIAVLEQTTDPELVEPRVLKLGRLYRNPCHRAARRRSIAQESMNGRRVLDAACFRTSLSGTGAYLHDR